MYNPLVALTIAGSDSSGGAGIQADLKAFAAVGVHGASVITCITAQNTTGVKRIEPVNITMIDTQLDAILSDLQPLAIKTGMLFSSEIVELVCDKLENYRQTLSDPADLYLVVDPVLTASTGEPLIKIETDLDETLEKFIDTIKKRLFPLSTVLTPNLPEASRILGRRIVTMEDMKTACAELKKLGPMNVVLKGGHRINDPDEKHKGKAIDILFNDNYHFFESEYLPKDVHGTGCTFASALAGYLLTGLGIKKSIEKAKELVRESIKDSLKIGNGNEIINVPARAWKDTERNKIISEIETAVDELLKVLKPEFIPEVGINIGYALSKATTLQDICALTGRIVRVDDVAGSLGRARFGASKHVGRIILAVMRYDESIRCAMNIKYTSELVQKCKGTGFSIGTFNREFEPMEVSSMEWGTRTAIEELGFVPDMIYDEGGVGKEPMIRLLGPNPNEVIEKLKRIL